MSRSPAALPRSPAALARLTLLTGLASAHLTLLARASMGTFAIMAAPGWLAGGLLLLEAEQAELALPPAAVPWPRFLSGLALLVWPLLVLSFAARLYDPLMLLVPTLALPGLALLAGLPPGSALLKQLLLIGALLPLQVLFNRFLPTAPLAVGTARVSSFLLVLLGRAAFPEGRTIVMEQRLLVVDASCTGVTTIALCLAAAVLLQLLLPPPWIRRPAGMFSNLSAAAPLAAFALMVAFLVNAARVALLGLTRHDPNPTGAELLSDFVFWHQGGGSHLFSLVAMSLVCGGYVLALELHHRGARREGR